MSTNSFSIPEFAEPDPDALFLASRQGLRTYGDLHRFSQYFLEQLQTVTGDLDTPVGFIAESCDELVMAIASCWLCGIPFVCFDPSATDDELRKQLSKLELSVVVTGKSFTMTITSEPTLSLQSLDLERAITHANHDPGPQTGTIDPNRVFGYFFTSGTTGIPKIVPLKRRQMLFAAKASAENFRPQVNHFWLLCLPMNHIGGISIILRSLLYGSGIYRMGSFRKEMVTSFLSENKLFQAASFVPTMLKRLLEIPAFRTHNNFRAILLGGGPILKTLVEKAVNKGIPVVASYGMTETCAQIAANPYLKPSGTYIPKKSVGRIFPPNEIQIRDDGGTPLGRNNSGVIWLKGPQVFDGYRDPSLNNRVFDENGWFRTGDFGHINANGHLFIETRRSDLIVTGGENVSPEEVENELVKYSEIREAAVLGLPDEEWGQRVVAVVVGIDDHKLDEQLVRKKLEKRLSPYKIPKQLLQVDSLPTNRTGKVVRRELVKLFEQKDRTQ
ncbi:MAG: AMP-binding protein [Balneolaceae bacterium]|nr:AMP-binding protein [Balneolaceae bacterium]